MTTYNLTLEGKLPKINGEETLLISGAMHYFRTLPEAWEDRLRKIKMAGFNCVETYVPWNLHEPEEGVFNYEGLCDVVKFIETAKEVGLFVIFRPSPYICAEWEFGGFPYWLLKYDLTLRTFNEKYIKYVERFFDDLIPKIIPLLSTNGGPVIAMQIENEYGSFGNDKVYLGFMRDKLIELGVNVPLFTSDGPGDLMLTGGTVDKVWKTVNFGSRTEQAMEVLHRHQQNMPDMVMEFWIGWFDHWGEKHHTRSYEDVVKEFEIMLKNDVSANFYMFHGGTNFGFLNGANHDGKTYMPTGTSYDYDSLLSECGDITEKYEAIKKCVEEYKKSRKVVYLNENEYSVENSKKIAISDIKFQHSADFLSNLKNIATYHRSETMMPMEKFHQDYGIIVYETKVPFFRESEELKISIPGVGDRAQVYVNGEYVGLIDRFGNENVVVKFPKEENTLTLVIENMGRVNYGHLIWDHKGAKGVKLNYQFMSGWDVYTVPLRDLSKIEYKEFVKKECREDFPTFLKGEFNVEEIGDTFIETLGWKKGVIYVNGFNLGRYWEIGPATTVYLPQELLKKGKNEIVVLELHSVKESMFTKEDHTFIK